MRRMVLECWFVGVLGMVAVGCSHKEDVVQKTHAATANYAADRQEPAPKKEGIQIPAQLNSHAGTATRLGPMPKRQKLWTVRWKEARIDLSEGGQFSGTMQGVTGSMYADNGTVASTFESQDAEAVKHDKTEKQKDILRLSGNVKIVSREHKATLLCDKVEYQPGLKQIRAVGNVRVDAAGGVLNAGNEVIATSDLTQIATPNLFKK